MPVDQSGGQGKRIPTMGAPPKTENVNGVSVVIHSDGRIDLPGGIRLPKGSKWSAKSKGEIRSGDGKLYYVHDGKVTIREKVSGASATVGPAAKSGLVDLHGAKYRERVLYDPTVKPATNPTRAVAGPPGPRGYPTATGQTREQAGLLSGADFSGKVHVRDVLDLGMSFVGTDYVWGGATPEQGFDCSGLLQYIYAKNGVAIPRVSADQAKAGTAVAVKDAQPGDLIAFDNNPKRPGIDHIGIYLGGGQMLQSPHTGAQVQVVKVNLATAKTIRRVVGPQAFSGLTPKAGGKFVYDATVTPGAASPKSITPAKGGGDSSSPGAQQAAAIAQANGKYVAGAAGSPLEADGKIDPAAALAAYGSIAELAKTVPDIKRVISQAIAQGIDPGTTVGQQRFQQMLQGTAWWKQTATKQRENQILKANDPRKWKENRQAYHDKIVLLARSIGVPMNDPAVLDRLAERAMNLGWDDSQIRRYVAADIKVGATNTGETAITVDALKAEAADWLVPLSEATLQQWTRQIVSGDVPAEAFTSYLKDQAKSLIPQWADAIDKGATVKQYSDPYKQYAGQLLEIDPNTIDLVHDPKFSRALFNLDPKTGERKPMSLAEWQNYLRATPDYAKTAQAVDQGARFATDLVREFGKAVA